MGKKNVLLTGGTGFIGRNVKKYLQQCCYLFAPNRTELNLLDEEAVKQYIVEHQIQIVIHAANPNPVKNELDQQDKMFEDSIRIFMNLYNAKEYYDRMYTLGSGAEYDKRRDLHLVKEEDAFVVPSDSYGLAKSVISRICESSEKHYNLRIFACYGPTDHESKFITHVIRCCLRKEDITIRQNCFFDYMHVEDLAKILDYFIYHKPQYHTYNVCTGKRVTLEAIAKEVQRQMNVDNQITILKDGWNKEYTGNNERLLNEIDEYPFISLEAGIEMQIKSETEFFMKGL